MFRHILLALVFFVLLASNAWAQEPDSPLCTAHSNSTFHTLWNTEEGCHYDHEHGQNPFTSEVNDAFPDFDLFTLLGNVQVGHTNPSSPMENTHKHGGFKWQVDLTTPMGCTVGFEGAQTGVNASVIQYHAFGDASIEMEARVHSAMALLRQCRPTNPTDYGYIYLVQHVDYGQRVTPYQGTIIPYPDTPLPAYQNILAPYFSIDCVGVGYANCRTDRNYIINTNANANSTWTSKVRTGKQPTNFGTPLFGLLFRARDTYNVIDSADLLYPFTHVWLCSNDNGLTYTPGCRYNNTTTRVHDFLGTIPPQWDNLQGFDTDPTVGRITAEGYVKANGKEINLSCESPGYDCFPIKMVNAFVGSYGTSILPVKIPAFSPTALPERDLYFCNDELCDEFSEGAISSGWLGQGN